MSHTLPSILRKFRLFYLRRNRDAALFVAAVAALLVEAIVVALFVAVAAFDDSDAATFVAEVAAGRIALAVVVVVAASVWVVVVVAAGGVPLSPSPEEAGFFNHKRESSLSAESQAGKRMRSGTCSDNQCLNCTNR